MEVERHKVNCKTLDEDSPDRIKAIGENHGMEVVWKMDVDEAIRRIKKGNLSLYTEANGMAAEIIVGVREGNEFLKTCPDGTDLNNIVNIGFCFDVIF